MHMASLAECSNRSLSKDSSVVRHRGAANAVSSALAPLSILNFPWKHAWAKPKSPRKHKMATKVVVANRQVQSVDDSLAVRSLVDFAENEIYF